ncbi:putative nitroreductase, partial [Lachnellula subtilissima]
AWLPPLLNPSSHFRKYTSNTNPNPTIQHATMSPSTAFLEALKERRSIYALSKSSPISDSAIQDIITQAILQTPTSFNSQTTRAILLVKGEHDKLWDIAKEVLKGIVPADQYAATEARLSGFQAGYGTVLFFTSRSAVQKMQDAYAIYADRFPPWAVQSNGMTQLAIWTALELEGLGANLQHYNPLIDQKVQAAWGVDEDWELNAQLVFGKKEGEAAEKAFQPIEERFKSFGV